MNMLDLIRKKRSGGTLTHEELSFMLRGYQDGVIPDYQMSAMLMAICFQGMTSEETAQLTMLMTGSGEMADLSAIHGVVVDKHSTGGVGDTTTLILAPLVAACGGKVAKMSGRGLGHTGGTIDKLEAIPGFITALSPERMLRQVSDLGAAISAQSEALVPADRMLYALRDASGTVESIPLIASSVMSKKLATGAQAIVLDVKCGRGAFMSTLQEARKLAQAMVSIGQLNGRRMCAVISSMQQPLGSYIGNALEVYEAVITLSVAMPSDLLEVSLNLGARMLTLSGLAHGQDEALAQLERALKSGRALDRFKAMVRAQGGDVSVIEHPERLLEASFVRELKADRDGYLTGIDAHLVGEAAQLMGAGRLSKDDAVDLTAGIRMRKRIGDPVARGETLALCQGASIEKVTAGMERLCGAYEYDAKPAAREELLLGIIE